MTLSSYMGNENRMQALGNKKLNTSHISEMVENVMHETCSNNVLESHVPETVVNIEVYINNGSYNKAQMLT